MSLAGIALTNGAANATGIRSGATPQRPNVVLILTDDQGMGDVGVYGNPAVRTPHIDALHAESVRFTNFHVDPTCSPTRAALLTGQYSLGAGVWHTIMARHMLPPEKVTLAEVLLANDYSTSLFGKWHLGDNYPYRPQDQGFETVVMHGGGGVGQAPDYWGNTQFGDTYFVNGQPTPFAGYATDVWFDEASRYIRRRVAEQRNETDERPFFTLITTNAPHTPWRAPPADVEAYLDFGLPNDVARFYAMITNLDRRIGRLRATLRELSIHENTILIFATDNGSSMSEDRFLAGSNSESFADFRLQSESYANWTYNFGMRGFKTDVYEGGHRVPFFIYWPDGGLDGGRDIDTLAAHFDVLPTLTELLQLEDSAHAERDGMSLLPALRGEPVSERTLVVTNQRVDQPSPRRPAVVMTQRWRFLPHEGSLFDIVTDPGQNHDVATQHREVTADLQAAYDVWWTRVTEQLPSRPRPIIGSPAEPVTRLTSHDFVHHESGSGPVAWFPGFGTREYGAGGPDYLGNESAFTALPFEVRVAESGHYRISLYFHDKPAAKEIPLPHAVLSVDGISHRQALSRGDIRAVYEISLSAGPHTLTGWFAESPNGDRETGLPAFFMYIERVHSSRHAPISQRDQDGVLPADLASCARRSHRHSLRVSPPPPGTRLLLRAPGDPMHRSG